MSSGLSIFLQDLVSGKALSRDLLKGIHDISLLIDQSIDPFGHLELEFLETFVLKAQVDCMTL